MRSSGWMFGLVLVAHAAGSSAPLKIRVHLFNKAKVPQVEIREAERVAGWMFQRAGIAVQWVECPSLILDWTILCRFTPRCGQGWHGGNGSLVPTPGSRRIRTLSVTVDPTKTRFQVVEGWLTTRPEPARYRGRADRRG